MKRQLASASDNQPTTLSVWEAPAPRDGIGDVEIGHQRPELLHSHQLNEHPGQVSVVGVAGDCLDPQEDAYSDRAGQRIPVTQFWRATPSFSPNPVIHSIPSLVSFAIVCEQC